MVEVREWFHRYNLTLETRPRHGMKLFSEMAIRRLPDRPPVGLAQQDSLNPLVTDVALKRGRGGADGAGAARRADASHHIRLTDEGELFLRLVLRGVRCVASAKGIRCRNSTPKTWKRTCARRRKISRWLSSSWRAKRFRRRRRAGCACTLRRGGSRDRPSAINADDDEALVNYILRYINTL